MPHHCPLVQALAGPNSAGSATGSPLARALFGPGLSVFNRSGAGSSAVGSKRRAATQAANPPSYPGTATGSKAGYNGRGANGMPPGSASTARASASPTSPVPSRPESAVPLDATGTSGTGTALAVPRKRTGLYVILGVLLLLLFAAGVTAAYYIGKGDHKDTPPSRGGLQNSPSAPNAAAGRRRFRPYGRRH
jgi:hypothetical protein